MRIPSFSFARLFALALLGASLPRPAAAFVPKPGQIVRFQSNVLRAQKPFSATGAFTVGRARGTYRLEWLSPGRYRVMLGSVPASVYAQPESFTAATWTLYRDGRACVLKTEGLTVNCGNAPSSWARLELGGQPDLAAKALKDEGFLSEDDAIFSETDAREIAAAAGTPTAEAKDKRVRLALSSNGTLPVSALEIRGPAVNVDVAGEEFPVVQFDQTFMAPLLWRRQVDGELVQIRATSDLEVSHEQPRFSHILAKRLDVTVAKQFNVSFTRRIEIRTSAKPTDAPKAITDLPTLQGRLSADGQALLKAFVLAH